MLGVKAARILLTLIQMRRADQERTQMQQMAQVPRQTGAPSARGSFRWRPASIQSSQRAQALRRYSR